MNRTKLLALSPEAVPEFMDNYDMIAHFGFEFGRQLINYPAGWNQLVMDRLKNEFTGKAQSEIKRFEECIITLGRRGGINYKYWEEFFPEIDWLENAIEQHAIRPVASIVDKEDGGLIVQSPKNAYKDHLSRNVRDLDIDGSKAENLVEPLHTLLEACSELWLVDPYFLPSDNEKQIGKLNFLKALLQYPSRRCRNFQCIVQDAKWREEFGDDTTAKVVLERAITPHLQKEQSITFIRTKTKLHARYALTKIGGIRYDRGFQVYSGNVDLVFLDYKKCTSELVRCNQLNDKSYYARVGRPLTISKV